MSLTFYLSKFIYYGKATNICEIFPLLLTTVHTVKSKGKILQNFVTFSEYMNFNFRHPEFRFIIEFYILLSDTLTAPFSSEELSELQKLLMKKHGKQNQDSEMSRWQSVV